MAFNNAGPLVVLAPGQSVTWSYSFQFDHGTQFASADIKPVSGPAAFHLAHQQSKRKFNAVNAVYFVTIQNQGPGVSVHNLQGGGMV